MNEPGSLHVGPIVYKTAQAMAFLFPEAQNDRSLTSRATTVPLTNNTGSLLAAYINSTLILAFNVSVCNSRDVMPLWCNLETSHGIARLLANFVTKDLLSGPDHVFYPLTYDSFLHSPVAFAMYKQPQTMSSLWRRFWFVPAVLRWSVPLSPDHRQQQ